MHVFLKENINKNDLVSFCFRQKEFDPTTHEFSKEGKRYDVVKTEFSGENIIVYCFKDDKEMELASEFHDLLFQNTTSKGDLEKRITSIFNHLRMEYVFENPFCLQHLPPLSIEWAKKRFLL